MFDFVITDKQWRIFMANITPALIAALKKLKVDADNLSPAELAQLETAVNEKVTSANAELTARVTEAENDLKAINDAIVDGTLTPEETTTAIGEILEVAPVNA